MREPTAFSVRQLALRAFDLSERTARAGKRSAAERAERWRRRVFVIAQCAVTAGVAWWVAHSLVGHPAPFFAAVAAIITLGLSYGQRLTRAVQIAIGVSVGVLVGEGFLHLFGTGVWQIVLVCAVAMSVASLLGAGNLMATQAAVQAVIVTALPITAATSPFGRWVDALIGCSLALLVATVAPGSPVRKPLILAAAVLKESAGTLRAAATALRDHDAEAADAVLHRARASESGLQELDEAATEGIAVVRSSPFRRKQRGQVEAYADLAAPLDRMVRNLRVLARRAAVVTWRGNEVPTAYLSLMDDVAQVMEFMAGEMFAGRLPTAARTRLEKLGLESSHLPMAPSLSAVVILAQTRSMIADLLELIGVDAATARAAIPDIA
ncbi:FUSC family protein [Pseudactinotalea sp.]|uniref:FUSC family protein n=1 Tax=Pseudactinotalea sp. TaxID=1926260 RepID=UPI003B3B2278